MLDILNVNETSNDRTTKLLLIYGSIYKIINPTVMLERKNTKYNTNNKSLLVIVYLYIIC